jgi:hypothetical protein
MNKREQQQQKQKAGSGVGIVDIGTAWLLLSHGAFLGATVGSAALAQSFLVFLEGSVTLKNTVRGLSIMWAVASLVIAAWTIYAIAVTWRTSNEVRSPVFHPFAFASLILVVLLVVASNLWTLVILATQ